MNFTSTSQASITLPQQNRTTSSKVAEPYEWRVEASGLLVGLLVGSVAMFICVVISGFILHKSFKKHECSPRDVIIRAIAFNNCLNIFFLGSYLYSRIHSNNNDNAVYHELISSFLLVCLYTSATLPGILALDSTLFFKMPYRYNEVMTCRKTVILCVLAFVYSILLAFFPVFLAFQTDLNYTHLFVGICCTAISFPLIPKVVFYYCIMKVIRQHKSKIEQLRLESGKVIDDLQEQKRTTTLVFKVQLALDISCMVSCGIWMTCVILRFLVEVDQKWTTSLYIINTFALAIVLLSAPATLLLIDPEYRLRKGKSSVHPIN